jgi:hypothetical protein
MVLSIIINKQDNKKEEKKMEKITDNKTNFSKIVVDFYDNEGNCRKIAFYGEWLVQEERDDLSNYSYAGTEYSIARTAKGNFFVLLDKFGTREFHDYKIFDSFDAMKNRKVVPPSILSEVADAIDEDYEELLNI